MPEPPYGIGGTVKENGGGTMCIQFFGPLSMLVSFPGGDFMLFSPINTQIKVNLLDLKASQQ
jgi:hypothetical protein